MSRRRPAKSTQRVLPLSNLVTILVPVGVLTIQIGFGGLSDESPDQSVAAESVQVLNPLDLRVRISTGGYMVQGAGRVLAEPFVAVDELGEHDIEGLSRRLHHIKSAYPTQRRVVFLPDPDVPWRVLAATASGFKRSDLAPAYPEAVVPRLESAGLAVEPAR